MIAPISGVRVWLWPQPVDFRKVHDGLAALVQTRLGRDPFDGDVFIFRSRRADRVKIVAWHDGGLCLLYKRLEDDRFRWPPIREGAMTLSGAQLSMLLAGLDWSKGHRQPAWRPAAMC